MVPFYIFWCLLMLAAIWVAIRILVRPSSNSITRWMMIVQITCASASLVFHVVMLGGILVRAIR